MKAQIEQTRTDLGRDVDALAEKVDPRKATARTAGRVKQALGRVTGGLMGAPEGAVHAVSDGAEQAGRQVASVGHSVNQTLQRRTRGNPTAVGLVAFGVGWPLASVIPATGPEAALARTAKEDLEPITDPAARHLSQAAGTVAEQMKEHAGQAARALQESAQTAVHHVTEQAKAAVPPT